MFRWILVVAMSLVNSLIFGVAISAVIASATVAGVAPMGWVFGMVMVTNAVAVNVLLWEAA